MLEQHCKTLDLQHNKVKMVNDKRRNKYEKELESVEKFILFILCHYFEQ